MIHFSWAVRDCNRRVSQARGGRGSRMVLCTDGMANVGLGALDGLNTEKQRSDAESFYENLGREVVCRRGVEWRVGTFG